MGFRAVTVNFRMVPVGPIGFHVSHTPRSSSYTYAKEEAFLPEDAVNVSRNGEYATMCCNARTRFARRHRVIGTVLAEELENLTRPSKW